MRTPIWKIVALVLFVAVAGAGKAAASDLALTHAKVYVSPTDPPLEDATILIHDGLITKVGPSASIKLPHLARAVKVIDCKGLTVTAGFCLKRLLADNSSDDRRDLLHGVSVGIVKRSLGRLLDALP